MLQFNFSPFPNLASNRLNFRQLTNKDVSEIFLLRSDPRVMEFRDSTPAKDEKEGQAYTNRANDDVEKNIGITWGICLKGSDKIIGYIGFWNLQAAHYRTEVGYSLLPDYWRKGIMNEALQRIIKYAFEETTLHSLEANVNVNNKASIKLLEKNGFVKEAHFKENYFFDGKFLDSIIYSLVKQNDKVIRE